MLYLSLWVLQTSRASHGQALCEVSQSLTLQTFIKHFLVATH